MGWTAPFKQPDAKATPAGIEVKRMAANIRIWNHDKKVIGFKG